MTRKQTQALWAERGDAVRIALAAAFVRAEGRADASVALSPRERECLQGLADGEQLKQIAARLGIAYGTVEFHLRNARSKLGARTREQAVAIAIQRGIIGL